MQEAERAAEGGTAATAARAGPPRRGALRSRDFRLLWSGQAVSAIGDRIFPVAVALKVLDAGGGATALGLVLGAQSLAMVVFLVLGGVVADRLRRTRVMVAADLVRLVAVLGLALAPASVPVPALAALAFVVGAGQAFFVPANGALIPSVLGAEQLQAGNALNSAALVTAGILGPALGGVVVGLAGVGWAFGADATTFGVSLLTLVWIRDPGTARPRRRPSMAREALEGMRAVRRRPWLLAVLLMATAHLMLAVAPVQVLLPVVARARLGGNGAFSAMLVLQGVGAVGGVVLAGRWRPRRPGLVSLLGVATWVGVPVSLAFPFARWWVGGWELVGGFGIELFGIYWVTALQRDVPGELLARVTSLDYLVSFALMPVGLALTGPATAALGARAVLLAGAAVVAATTLPALAIPGMTRFATPGGPPELRDPQHPGRILLAATPGADHGAAS